jgi:EpsD family peptidyl-prolyl cis-trans isomerase
MLKQKTLNLVVAAGMATLLLGCGGEDAAPSGQSIARVNQEEITIHQLNLELAHAGRQLEEDNLALVKPIVEQLVNQSVTVQKALEEKLDRDPQVMQAIERAKRQILSQSYMERMNATVAAASEDAVRKFYDEHPELFSKRNIYHLNEMHLNNIPSNVDVEALLKESKSLDDVQSAIEQKKASVVRSVALKPAEQIPTELLTRLANMQKGQVTAIPSPQGGIMVVQLVNAAESPMTLQGANPYIKAFLSTQAKREASEKEISRLKNAARVEYLGRFAELAKNESSSPAPTEKTAEASKGADAAHESTLSNGISGLN